MDKFNLNEVVEPTKRAALLIHHPLLTASEVLITPPIVELYLQIKRTVQLKEPSCCFTAPSGSGKTSALNLIAKMLKNEIPGLPVYLHDTQNQQYPSIRAFFKNFLNTLKHGEMRGETYDLRLRVTNRLVDDAIQSGLNLVVLLMDESQAMSLQDFVFLKDIDNSLDRDGVKLITVMMGQAPDFARVVQSLHDRQRLDLIARFTMRAFTFRCFENQFDIEKVFDSIDTLCFPQNSPVTWTQFFFPHAFASGFRIKNESSRFMSALFAAAPTKADFFSFPARQLFFAIRSFMVDNASSDAPNMQLEKDTWEKAVRYAQVREAMILMNASNSDPGLKVII